MTKLIVCLDDTKSCSIHAQKVITGAEWEEVIIVVDRSIEIHDELFLGSTVLKVDLRSPTEQVAEHIRSALENKVEDLEVALNIFSCSGKMHMAVISAILKLGLGFRLVALTPDGVKEI